MDLNGSQWISMDLNGSGSSGSDTSLYMDPLSILSICGPGALATSKLPHLPRVKSQEKRFRSCRGNIGQIFTVDVRQDINDEMNV